MEPGMVELSAKKPLILNILKKQIPKECFEKSLPRSLSYMIRDLLLVSTCFYTYHFFSLSWLGLFAYWNIYGFLMWCLFVVGHDCGHGTFSRYPLINAICGHICHTPLLVPFFPWSYSHRKHHQFHNHKDKDLSHPWFSEEEMNQSLPRKLHFSNWISPFFAFFIYLYAGFFDGSHILPIGKLYRTATTLEKVKCLISTSSIVLFIAIVIKLTPSGSHLLLFYGGPVLFFCFWLFMVTYMHHHHEETVIYDDTSWSFVPGALQTIDRFFGYGIDKFHHNITDCHLVHHLFFTQIPHYHLKRATQHILPLIEKSYKSKKHKFFLKDFYALLFSVNFPKWTLKSKQHIENITESNEDFRKK